MWHEFKHVRVALCAGRHEIPVAHGAIFETIEDVTNTGRMEVHAMRYIRKAATEAARVGKYLHLEVYVTGLTPALVAVINAAMYYHKRHGVALTLWHYNRDEGEYFRQEVLAPQVCPFCGAEVPFGECTCPICGAQ